MILKGSQRSGAKQLAAHLLNDQDNDHVEVHSVEGFMANDVAGALEEMYAVSRATKCRQFMFSLSLSPPKDEVVTVRDFEDAIDLAMDRTGLVGQPRIVLFHEKNGRRHCHVVVSRIDLAQMKAINLPFFKTRLTELSRELYLSHGWDLPKGFADKSLADPSNFGLTEWQEAHRAKRDPREIKSVLKQCWAQSDNAASFQAALKDKGFWLCRGDRRGFVALDYKGGIYSLARWADLPSKELKLRLGNPHQFSSVHATARDISVSITGAIRQAIDEMCQTHVEAMKPLLQHRLRLVARQRSERQDLDRQQKERRESEILGYSQRFRKGLRGLFDWVTGRRGNLKRQIEALRDQAERRDMAEAHTQRVQQDAERHLLQIRIERLRQRQAQDRIGAIELLRSEERSSSWPNPMPDNDPGRDCEPDVAHDI